uniref:Uncharacterized protein n=1 Tax=Oryza brachyantha TaxID=4533 RepID=J3N827_ORYBR
MAIKDRFSGNPEGLTRTNHKPEWATERNNMDASKRAAYVKKIHERTKEEIEKKTHSNAAKVYKHRKKVVYEPIHLVWVHLRKERFPERFPERRKSKLMPRGYGPFKLLAKINDKCI